VSLALLGDVLVVLGLVVMTVGVYGLYRMPDVYTQVHASSKAVFLGVIALLAASVATRDGATVARAVLTAVFLTLTTPVAGHIVARAAYRAGERMETPGAVDESGSDLASDARRDGRSR
jgi:multicomponent Na+:H+ antiporter subunit G